MRKGRSSDSRRWRVATVTLCGGVLLLAGCLTLDQMAPPVGPQLSAAAARQGALMETLREGRTVYLTECARCHSIEPIGRYTSNRWREVLPRMSLEARLSARRSAALATYVSVARASLGEDRVPR